MNRRTYFHYPPSGSNLRNSSPSQLMMPPTHSFTTLQAGRTSETLNFVYCLNVLPTLSVPSKRIDPATPQLQSCNEQSLVLSVPSKRVEPPQLVTQPAHDAANPLFQYPPSGSNLCNQPS